ncbi:MAG: NmrA family NAD(P)-binding protein [Roseiarcus sp.]|jgi:uncharacterized protein YbjT (DUF2867 family)
MTILVSNANGKVGHEVAKALMAAGQSVRIGARAVAKARAEFPGAEIVELDFARPATLATAVKGVDAVFSATPYELLPQAEQELIAAAKAAGVARFVKMSAMGVEGDPNSPHMLAEKALKESGLAWTVLRPTFFMQNYATMMAPSVRAGAIYEAAAEGATSFVDARDIAAVAAAALTKPGHAGKTYTLTGPAALTRKEVAAALSEAIGKPVAYVAVDDAALRGAMAGAPPVLIELMSALYGYVRQGYTARVAGDVAEVTGRPARSFAAFAADHAAAWR